MTFSEAVSVDKFHACGTHLRITGNPNAATAQLSIVYGEWPFVGRAPLAVTTPPDTTPPTVALSAPVTHTNAGTPITVTGAWGV